MALDPAQRAYIVKDHVIGPFVINLLINAAIGWAMFKDLPRVPVFGEQSAVGDLVVTSFALPFIVCLIATPLVRLATKRGKAPPFPDGLQQIEWLGRIPSHLALRALSFGLFGVLLCAPPIIVTFKLLTLHAIGLTSFAWLKGLICAALAAVISPPIALLAMAESTVTNRGYDGAAQIS